MSMKKTFYHNFMPTKAEEEACKANNIQFQPSRILVEIKDVYPTPVVDYHSPWKIKKTLIQYEVVTGKIVIPFANTFDHVFRYWTLAMANHVVLRNKVGVVLWDVTDQNNPKRFVSEHSIYFEMMPNDDYVLACMDLFKDRSLNVDDEIGLYWDNRSSTFQFKLLRKVV